MASNLGKVTKFCAPSQELESEWPPGPHKKPSAVGPRGSASTFAERSSNTHASRDECPCRECRHARRREFGTLPFDAPSLTLREIWDRAPFWLRLVLIWVTTATACLLAAVVIDQALAFVVGIE